MKRFKSAGQAQRFLSAHDQVANLFRRPANANSADHRKARARALRLGPRWLVSLLASDRLIP